MAADLLLRVRRRAVEAAGDQGDGGVGPAAGGRLVIARSTPASLRRVVTSEPRSNICSSMMGDDHPELRRCGRCQELKPQTEFAWRRKRRDQLDNMCRPCR